MAKSKAPAPTLEEAFQKWQELQYKFWDTNSSDKSEKINCRIADLIDSYYGENTVGDAGRADENEARFLDECRAAGLIRDPKLMHPRAVSFEEFKKDLKNSLKPQTFSR